MKDGSRLHTRRYAPRVYDRWLSRSNGWERRPLVAQAFKRGRAIPTVVPRDTDVQAWEPRGRYKLTRVGVTNLVKPVQVRRPTGEVVLQPVIDVYVRAADTNAPNPDEDLF